MKENEKSQKKEENLEKTVKISLICYVVIGILFGVVGIFQLNQGNSKDYWFLYLIVSVVLFIGSFIIFKRIRAGFYKKLNEDKNFALINFGFIVMTTSLTFSQNALAIAGILTFFAGFFVRFPEKR